MQVDVDNIIQYIIGIGIIGALINRFGEIFYNSRKAKDSAERAHQRITETNRKLRRCELLLARLNGESTDKLIVNDGDP